MSLSGSHHERANGSCPRRGDHVQAICLRCCGWSTSLSGRRDSGQDPGGGGRRHSALPRGARRDSSARTSDCGCRDCRRLAPNLRSGTGARIRGRPCLPPTTGPGLRSRQAGSTSSWVGRAWQRRSSPELSLCSGSTCGRRSGSATRAPPAEGGVDRGSDQARRRRRCGCCRGQPPGLRPR